MLELIEGPPLQRFLDQARPALLGRRLGAILGDRAPGWSLRQQAALVALVERCVATNPAERFQSVADLRARFQSLSAFMP